MIVVIGLHASHDGNTMHSIVVGGLYEIPSYYYWNGRALCVVTRARVIDKRILVFLLFEGNSTDTGEWELHDNDEFKRIA